MIRLESKQTGRWIELKYDWKPWTYWFKVFWMTQNFSYQSFWWTDNNSCCTIDIDKAKDFLKLKVVAEDKDWYVIDESNEVDVKFEELENFWVACLKSYHWSTLTFRSKGIYDLYRVYDEKWRLCFETKDTVLEVWETKGKVRVDAFMKENGEYVLKWTYGYPAKIPDRKNLVLEPKLSVIVPLYNSELFMCRTIDSILSSSLPDIEIILIDDWSTDRTGEIADRYAENFKSITVKHQENSGVSVARNRWMELARWKYLAFCDNDDIVHPFMYEKLYDACIKEWVDAAICLTKVITDFDDYYWYPTVDNHKEDIVIYSNEQMWRTRAVKWENMFRAACWNRIVRTDVAKMAQFPTEYTGPWVLYEDVAYTSTLYSYIDKFAFVRDAHYTRDKRKQKTVWTASTRHSQKEDNDYVWRMFIYAYSYPLYHRCEKNSRRADYSYFKRLVEAYDKFTNAESELRDCREERLTDVIERNKLYDNDLIMDHSHLAEVVESLS